MSQPKTFKLLRCHPKKTRKKNDYKINDSCYDDKSILLLKDEWNKKNPTNKIESSNITEIWNNLKEKIMDCTHELCWLDKLVNKINKKKIKKQNFAPIAPLDEWKKYNNWLSSTEFNEIMGQYMEVYPEFLYLGPSPIDFDKIEDGKCIWPSLCNLDVIKEKQKGKTKFGIVLNLDTNDGDGSHWVAMFIDLNKRFVFYFESTGSTMPKEVTTLMDRVVKQCKDAGIKLKKLDNMKVRHQYGLSECGMYCLYFIITLLEETNTPERFLDKKNKIPDSEMINLRDIYFNKL